jgi:hypothetical protein
MFFISWLRINIQLAFPTPSKQISNIKLRILAAHFPMTTAHNDSPELPREACA